MKRTAILVLVLFKLNFISNAQTLKGLDINGEVAGDQSGRTVSMPDRNTIAIGSMYNDGGGTDAGHVRIYRWNGNVWLQKGADIDGEAAGDWSGYSVSMPDSNIVAIGAIGNDGNGNSAGHVRIYRWNGSFWVQKGSDIDGEAADDGSGVSVSMPDSNTVAIGAFQNDGNGTNAGHVRIYRWNGSVWVQKGSDIDGEVNRDESGFSVSMPDSNTVAIGASYNDGNLNNSGHVRIYRWNGIAWVQKGIDIDGEDAGDQSGVISMPDSNTIAIGALQNDGNNEANSGWNVGHVRIFRWNGSVWVQRGNDIDGEAEGDWSGFSVSMSDSNTVAIGAISNRGNGADAGQVRIYRWNGSDWMQKGIDIDGKKVRDWLGASVCMPDSNTVAIGAIGNGAGYTQVYSFCSATTSSFAVTACKSYTWPLNGITYTGSTNSPRVIYANSAGCDSVLTLNLTINKANVSINNSSPILTANAGTNATYQWLNCGNNFAVISGATNQIYTATTNGSYAVEVKQNGCIDTSVCQTVNNVGILESSFGTNLLVYPNPTKGKLSIDLGSSYNNVTVIISNALGQVVQSQNFSKSNVIQLYIPGEAGVFFIEVKSAHKKAVLKVMKE